MDDTNKDITAAILVIGNEILSGRTQDVNVKTIADKLNGAGIPVREVRIVPDVTADIVAAVNALRNRYTYVFTTGGIGPTHDDITVDAIASAFGVDVIEDPRARALLCAHYGEEGLTPGRLRMARLAYGADIIHNPVSSAPGMKIQNVYVMAGVPNIMSAMLDGVVPTLRHGPQVHSVTVSAAIAESVIAADLGAVALRYADLDIGSYPWVRHGGFGTALVTRGTDLDKVQRAVQDILCMIRDKGVEPQIMD